jgi:hypothetical protein
MLAISTIPEALAELEKQTGRKWTDSELFDVVTNLGIEIHAAAPITAQVIVQEFIKGEGLKVKYEGMPIREGGLAVLFPAQVAQLWISGETLTCSPYSKNDIERDGEYIVFNEPVLVTLERVRIRLETLQFILNVWQEAQSGRWIEDNTSPDGMRRKYGPAWMFPQHLESPVTAPNTIKGIPKQRVIAAFGGLHFNDGRWSKALGHPPGWLKSCRVMPGTKATSSLWNPVEIAVALLDKGIPIKKLDTVFVGLRDWSDEWKEKSEYFRDAHT